MSAKEPAAGLLELAASASAPNNEVAELGVFRAAIVAASHSEDALEPLLFAGGTEEEWCEAAEEELFSGMIPCTSFLWSRRSARVSSFILHTSQLKRRSCVQAAHKTTHRTQS